MSWYCVYSVTTGAAVSFTSTQPDSLPVGMAYVAIDHQPGIGEAWDAQTKTVVAYVPVPASPTGAFYEEPAWQWVYAIGASRLASKAPSTGRTAKPTDAAAQTYIRANVAAGELDGAISEAASRRDRILAALEAAGIDPATNAAYADAVAVLAFLGGCL